MEEDVFLMSNTALDYDKHGSRQSDPEEPELAQPRFVEMTRTMNALMIQVLHDARIQNDTESKF